MSLVLSLQGCMAVGKTTALKYIEENRPDIHVSYEMHNDAHKYAYTVMDFGAEEIEFYTLKRKWFIGRNDTDVLNVDKLTKDEKCKAVEEWIDSCIEKHPN